MYRLFQNPVVVINRAYAQITGATPDFQKSFVLKVTFKSLNLCSPPPGLRLHIRHIKVNSVVQQRCTIQYFLCGVCVWVMVLRVVVPCNPVGENWRSHQVVQLAVIYIMSPDPKSINFDHEEEAAYFSETLSLTTKIVCNHKLEDCRGNLNEQRLW
jgi:hypothetical protein